MKKSDFYYELPEERIAQFPLAKRDESKLLVFHNDTKDWEHRQFKNIIEYLEPGDCLVLNNTKVIPARLLGTKRDSSVAVEFLLLKRLAEKNWEVIVRPGRRLHENVWVDFIPGCLAAQIKEVLPNGNRIVEFDYTGIWEEVLDKAGTMPLPPYIKARLDDPTRYNTVYAKLDGSAAAPTAGLHFTEELLEAIKKKGVHIAYVTLHVGLGTFRPVKAESIEDHEMHSEYFEYPAETAAIIAETKTNKNRIIAVGTTSSRVLESVAQRGNEKNEDSGWTDIFIYPGYQFKLVDCLITNFHLPESTLLMLVSALTSRESMLAAYQDAIEHEYRFFSFGDAMLIENKRE